MPNLRGASPVGRDDGGLSFVRDAADGGRRSSDATKSRRWSLMCMCRGSRVRGLGSLAILQEASPQVGVGRRAAWRMN